MFVINAILLIIAAQFIKGFHIDSFTTALVTSVVISILSSLLNMVFK
ncbi:phage holin family protein [Candidatus Gottesmanbacteria bacterium]|nr:phage holin family protein [Candidatus Gottesmanbacteria bacterium]